jgi:bifunctional non-homologous end joining protein LigD
MGLSQYHAKRDFKKTPEPHGRIAKSKGKALSYLIQKHAASHLHYDFRLELNGVLLSWAVPKGPSLDPADKRLAMHVEDHPLEYGGFEGTIPQGQYGGGTVMLWDRGTWTPVGDAAEGYRKGHLKFDLDGEKLKGRWALVRTHGSRYGGKAEAWLLIKDTDEFARRGLDARIVEAEPDSVVSGRTLEDIAQAKEHEWHSNRSVKANVRAGAIEAKKTPTPKTAPALEQKEAKPIPGPAGASGARRAALPATLSPALCTLVDTPPKGEDWLHEVKYDGYRFVCRIDKGEVRIITRSGKDWTERFGEIAKGLKQLKLKSAWIDGELCAMDEAGRSSFQALQNALSGTVSTNLVFFAFDLPYLDGYDLRDVVLTERKRLLAELLKRPPKAIRYSPEIRGSGDDVFSQACSLSLEGIVSKRSDSKYGAGLRTRNWVKVKCELRQEMVIGGFTDPQGSRAGFGALLLGVYEEGKLRYAGKVGTGFDDALLAKMRSQLDKLEQTQAPFYNPPRGYEAKGAHWVEPRLVAEIKFTEWSDAGALRHPVFVGLREDKMATEVVRENPRAAGAPQAAPGPKSKAKKAADAKPRARASSGTPPSQAADTVAGIKLSHPDKLLFPEAGLTKLSIARYYESISDWILPHIRTRPLSLVRCPDGWSKECFYQKHADKSVNAAVSRVEVPEGGGTATYFAANTLPALVGLVQWGVVELHPWGSRSPNPEKPDRLIFDFDPADDVPYERVVEAVQTLKTLLDTLGLAGFLKTTGGKGLHVVVPIKRTLTWPQAKAFTKGVAELLTKTFPDRYLATLSKSKRTGKIFIDYLRNAEGATAIAPYGIRSRKNAPVSTPIEWKELAKDVRFDYFNVKTVPGRLAKLRKDPWEAFESSSQTVTAAMFAKVGARQP